MNGLERGYVRLWRKIEESAIWALPADYLRLWLWCLTQCAHYGNTDKRRCPPGSFTTSYRQMAEALAWIDAHGRRRKHSPKHLLAMVKSLEKEGMLRAKNCGGQYTRLTIVKWRTYNPPPQG